MTQDGFSSCARKEYPVGRVGLAKGDVRQIESITFGWCDYGKALEFIRSTLNGEDDKNEWARPVTANIQTPQEHGRCSHCA